VRTLALFLAFTFTSIARADTSGAPDRSGIPVGCDHEQGPFWRAQRELDQKPLRNRSPFDWLRDVSASHALFTRHRPTIFGARVFDRVTGGMQPVAEVAVALVEDRAGALIGVLASDNGLALVQVVQTGGTQRWNVPFPVAAHALADVFHELSLPQRPQEVAAPGEAAFVERP
jgi:hypothetical protein